MAQTSLVNKALLLIPLLHSFTAMAGEGTGHTHESNTNMQVLGVFIILIIAVAGFYFLSKKK